MGSQTINDLSQKTLQFGDENRAGFQALSTEISASSTYITDESKSEHARLSSQITKAETNSEMRSRAVLTHLNDQAKNDTVLSHRLNGLFQSQDDSTRVIQAGIQAAQLSNRKEQEITRTMLGQYHDHLQSIFGRRANYALIGRKASSSSRGRRSETKFFFRYLSLSLPIGNLEIAYEQNQEKSCSLESIPQRHTMYEVNVTFMPPLWLSRLALKYALKIEHDDISNEWDWGARLRPLTINTNPLFVKALKKGDVTAVLRSFERGLAHLNDWVFINNLVNPWEGVRCLRLIHELV